jgi:hypothetical protein
MKNRPTCRLLITTLVACGVLSVYAQPQITLPNKKGSVKFAIIGDSGTGGGAQQKVQASARRGREVLCVAR